MSDLRISSRRGRFTIPMEMLSDDMPAVQAVFALCVPFRAEMLFHTDVVEYAAISPAFDELGKLELMPWYDVEINRDGLTVGVRFVRRAG
tara:strand:+ start:497 stop:766 length:270 start_codon:yes stop_codon:yes gene_type:complete